MTAPLPSLAQTVRLGSAGRVHRASVIALDGPEVVLDLPVGEAVEGRAMLSFPRADGGVLLPGRLRSAAGRVRFLSDDGGEREGQRRDAYRLPVSCAVTVGPLLLGAGDVARTRDLSVGGALLEGARQYAPGARLALRVELGDGSATALDAVVVRREPGSRDGQDASGPLAVAFVGVDQRQERELSRFIFAEQRRQLAAR